MIDLWRHQAEWPEVSNVAGNLPAEVFPSARQALVAALDRLGCQRDQRISLPLWSSHCVISAVGHLLTPFPQDMLEDSVGPAAILIYEPWGWRYADSVYRQIRDRFTEAILVIDAVDSADLLARERQSGRVIEVLSLSKITGMPGGGLAWVDGQLVIFEPQEEDLITDLYEQHPADPALLHLYKNEGRRISAPLAANLLHRAYRNQITDEYEWRQTALARLAAKQLLRRFPTWMQQVSSAPGILPWRTAMPESQFAERLLALGVQPIQRRFNFCDNPLGCDYQRCWAVPVHRDTAPIFNELLQLLEHS